ncbi:MAG: D-alanyl-D-alanine carboxypeptidase family protein [Actinomycetota bacterium]|nr:D-alanyl-D-alanine carboxypeptidase family protein [Actinomycetota bacterium]
MTESRDARRRRRQRLVIVGIVVLAMLASALAAVVTAFADPSDQPGGTSAVLDTPELDELQARAAQIQGQLQDRQAAVADILSRLESARAEAVTAQTARREADLWLAAQQQTIAGYASAIYRDGSAPDELRLFLTYRSPGDMVAALGYLDAIRTLHEQGLADAERARRQAVAADTEAAASLAAVEAEAASLQSEASRVEQAAAAVTDELTAALATVNAQLAELQQAQLEVNARTAAEWQNYLAQLSAAGVVPPHIGELLDPARVLPPGLVPVGLSTGGANPGAAQLPRVPSSLLVLSDQTIGAVSAAMGEMNLPYAPGTTGPDSWDCGTLIQAAYGTAGYSLPATAQDLWASLPPISAPDALPGDLVFLGSPQAGISHVGIGLDAQTMLTADGLAGAVIVRRIPPEQLLGYVRPVLPAGSPRAIPERAPGALPVTCGATVYPASYGGDRAWGGYPNGLIPPNALCPVADGAELLRCDAAAAYSAMAASFAATFGRPMCLTDGYRTFGSQVTLYGQKPHLAAVPGTSNHGWALAVDLCGGIQNFGTPEYHWMVVNAGRFGWVHPTWADPGNGREEPWHWEYAGG